ncbi:MAG TPA: fibronectin type III domain-containing protein [Longimicrobiales bacterium]|nr:fibronectin type III domain-containing protein [Longimicrobiales bacterium]
MTRTPARSRAAVLVAAALVATSTCRDVEITTVDVGRIEILPADPSVQVNESLQLTARVLSDDGDPLGGRTIEWTSLTPEIAGVDQGGSVTGVAVGTASIRAASEGVSATTEVDVTPGPAIGVNPANLEFVAIEHGASPGDRTIAVTNSGAGSLAGLQATIEYAAGGPTGWLSAALSGSTAPASLVLGADHDGLEPGSYHATVRVAAAGASNSPVGVGVTLTVLSPQPAISVAAPSVTFSAAAAGADPAPRSIGITNAGGGTLSGLSAQVTYASGQRTGWLTATIGQTAPTSLVLTARVGNLPAGTYNASVRIASSVAQNSPQTVSVTFTVGAALPAIVLDPTSLSFDAVRGGSNPAARTVAIRNGGGANLDGLAISVTYPGGQAGGWLTTSLSSPVAPASLTVGVVLGSLASGSYSASIRVSSPAASNSPQSIDVTLEVREGPPAIAVNPTSVAFAMTTQQNDPEPVSVQVTNAGGGTLTGLSRSVSYTSGQPTGWLTATLSGTTAPTSVVLTAKRGALAPGTYTARVRLSAGSATNSPVDVPVSFTVADVAPASPASLTSTVVSERRINLTWTDRSDNEASFRIERSVSGGNWSEIASTAPGVVAYVDSTGLAASTVYLYRVSACNAAGCSAPTGVSSATTAPAPPSALNASMQPPATISLTWRDNSSDETGFRIERSTDGTSWSTLHTAGADATSYTDATGAPQTTYHYRVRACRGSVCSTPSGSVNATTGAPLPAAPSGLSASATSVSSIGLSWDAAGGSVSEYRIERRGPQGPFAQVGTVSGAVTTYGDSGLQPATTYTYRVRACNDSGCSSFSNEATATTLPLAPGTPPGLTATATSPSRIELSWGAASGVVGDYRLERRSGGGAYILISTLPSSARSYADTDLDPATTYTYRISACNIGGCSGFSGEASATTHPVAPDAPTGLQATTVSSSHIRVQWNGSAGADEYRIERRREPSGSFAQVAILSEDARSFESTGLAPDTTYTYRIRACNAGGCSPYSNEASSKTYPLAPGVPGSPSATATSPTTAQLSWTAGSGQVDEYRIQRKTGADGSYAQVGTAPGGTLQFDDSGLAGATTYVYRVAACNVSGCSAFSTEASVTTPVAPPGAPSGASAAPASSAEIDLSWGAASGSVDSYVIGRASTTGGPYTNVATLDASARSYRDSGLEPTTTYYYLIEACNASACTGAGEISATTHPLPPGAPANVTTSVVSPTEIRIAWDAAAGVVAEYRIERGDRRDGPYAVIATVDADSSSYVDSGLATGSTFYYRVLACNVSGCTASEEVAGSTSPPNAPQQLSALAVSATRIDLQWEASRGEVTDYRVERRNGTGWGEIGSTDGNTLTYSDGSVQSETEYRYRVRACNAAGCSPYSKDVRIATESGDGTGAISAHALSSGSASPPAVTGVNL